MKNEDNFTVHNELEKVEPKFKKPYLTFGTIEDLKNKNFSKSNNFLNKFYEDLDINEVKIINSLIFIFNSYNNKHKKDKQIQEHFKNIVYNEGFFTIPLKDMLNLIQSNNRNLTLKDIDNHLENIRKKSLKYKKITIKNNKEYISTMTTSFIYKYETHTPKDLFGDNINKLSTIDIYIDRELYNDIFQLSELRKIGGYTKDFNIDMNKLSSRLGYGLYEELIRITPLKNKDKGQVQEYDYIDDFTYNLKDLNNIFGTDFKYFSHMKPKIEIQYKKLLKLELIKDIYIFNYGRNKLNISIKRNILKEMYEKEGVIF